MMYIDGVYTPPSQNVPVTPGYYAPIPPGAQNGQIVLSTGEYAGVVNLAYPAVWKAVLSQAQITQLATLGTDPRTVSPSTMSVFTPLDQASGTFNDKVNGLPWVVTGGPYTAVPGPFNLPPSTPYPPSHLRTIPPN